MMGPSLALSIVIPVYNGAESVGELVTALAGLAVPGGHEIVLVNDCSPDRSLEVCRELLATTKVPVTLVNLSRNFGEHNAVMAGLRHARGAHIITMDDDLQNPPDEVLRLLEHAQTTGREVVYTHYASKEHARWRNIGSRFTNRVADWLLDKPKGLYLSTFRCMTAFVAEQVTRYDGPFPYVDGLILQVTQSVGALEVQHLPRTHGRSNYNIRRLVRLWLNMFVNFSVMPLRIATVAGFVISLSGLAGT
ncbi:MAG TPA: glycosyltransferase family 2 protein, partial [Stellaceae bacterium]